MDDQENAVFADMPTKETANDLCAYLVTLVSFTLVVFLSACAVTQSQQEGPVQISPPVYSLYQEGALFQKNKDFDNALKKYHAALDKARLVQDELGIGISLASIGIVHEAAKRFSNAYESNVEAVRYFRKLKNIAFERATLVASGRLQFFLGNHANAIEIFDEVLILDQKRFSQASEEGKAEILSDRGGLHFFRAGSLRQLGRFEESLQEFRLAAADFLAVGNQEGAGKAFWPAGEIAEHNLNMPELAVKLYADAAPLLEAAGQVSYALNARFGLGEAQLKLGQYQGALVTFEEVVARAEGEGLAELIAWGHLQLGSANEHLGELKTALSHYQLAHEKYRVTQWAGKPFALSLLLGNLGNIYRLLSRYDLAIEYFWLSSLEYRKLSDAKGEADALTRLAEVYAWIGDNRAATEHYKRAWRIYGTINDELSQINVSAGLIQASYFDEEEPDAETFQYAREASSLVDRIAEVASPAVSKLWKFKIELERAGLTKINEEGKASEFRKDVAWFDSGWFDSQLRINKQVAQEWQILAPQLGDKYLMVHGNFFQRRGIIALSRGELKEALSDLKTAEQFLTSAAFTRELVFEWGKAWFYLGETYRRLKRLDLAVFYFFAADNVAINLQTPERHWVQAAMARALSDKGDIEGAKLYYEAALRTFESVFSQQDVDEIRAGVLQEVSNVYRDFTDFLLAQHDKTKTQAYLDQAFKYTELGRARVFLDMLARGRAGRVEASDNKGETADETMRRQLAELHIKLQRVEIRSPEESKLLAQIESLRATLSRSQQSRIQGRSIVAQTTVAQPVTLRDVQSALSSDSIFLEYSASAGGSLLWAITKDQARVFRLPDEDAEGVLKNYLATLKLPLTGPDELAAHIQLGTQLYQTLLEPADKLFRGKKHLIIAPDGPLYYLPFEALITPKSPQKTKRPARAIDANYLLKDFRVSYVPSGSVLVAQQKSGGQPKTQRPTLPLVAFGDPVYSATPTRPSLDAQPKLPVNVTLRESNLSPLEFSGKEVRRIAQIWNVSPSSEHINLGSRATLDRLRKMDLSKYQIVHFATHAVAGDRLNRFSQPALIMSQQANEEIGSVLLPFSDVLDLKLNAALVVLSACDTGLGRLRQGEGIVGLTRAFLYAGAASTVVSLWKVEDQSTSLLMERFYQNLKRGLGKAEALRQAKLDIMRSTIDLKATGMRQELAAPFYWAPFILVGDWGPIQTN